jgi:hypothetical protein
VSGNARARHVTGAGRFAFVALLAFACRSSPRDGATAPSAAPRGTLAGVSAASAPAPSASAEDSASAPRSDACRHLPLFNVYQRAGVVKERTSRSIRLNLRVDLHALDCGAPDATGHDMEVTLELRSNGARCEVGAAKARSTPFVALESETPPPPWNDSFVASPPVNLADPELEALTLVDETTRHALVFLPHRYFFYEHVKPGARLEHRLAGENDRGCCFGYTGAATSQWYFDYFRSPLAGELLGDLDDASLANFNRWATESELRDDLQRLVRRGFELSKKARIDTVFSRGEPAAEASVTVTDAWGDDPNARERGPHRRTLALRFSRKPCGECASGMTPWWLWSANDRFECATDAGFREVAAPCP